MKNESFNAEHSEALHQETVALQRIDNNPPALMAGVNIEALLEKAVTAESAVEVLERLMVMRREMKAEAAKEAFDAAMSAFQAECPTIQKDTAVNERNSSKVRYRYAELSSIVHQVKPLLQKHGFSHRETAEVEENQIERRNEAGEPYFVQGGFVTAICRVIHANGHSEESKFKIPIDPDSYMNQAQKFASALTFAKRYAFCNAFGILTGDQDDDSGSSQDDSRPPARTYDKPTPRANPAPAATRPPPAAAAPAAAPQEKAAATPANYATDAYRKKAIEKLCEGHPQRELFLCEFLKKAGCLMPNEPLNHWPLAYVPTSPEQLAQVLAAVVRFGNGEEAKFPFHNGVDPSAPEPARPTKAKPEDKAKAIEVPRGDTSATGEGWRDFVVPFGKHKGTKLEALDKNAMFGFWKNVKIELEWNGKPRPADKIASDRQFRAALDAAGEHYKFTQ